MADKVGNDAYGEILIYQTDDGDTNIEVKMQDETVWLTQQQLMQLYRCSNQISVNILSIYLMKANLIKIQLFGNSEQLRVMGKIIMSIIIISI